MKRVSGLRGLTYLESLSVVGMDFSFHWSFETNKKIDHILEYGKLGQCFVSYKGSILY